MTVMLKVFSAVVRIKVKSSPSRFISYCFVFCREHWNLSTFFWRSVSRQKSKAALMSSTPYIDLGLHSGAAHAHWDELLFPTHASAGPGHVITNHRYILQHIKGNT